ncbi:MAG: CoA transferase [bacterium]
MDKVLDMGGYAAGYCGKLFAACGADVVHLEISEPLPAWASATAMDLFLHAHKRKTATTDQGLIAALAAKADVVICEAGTADELDQLGFASWSTPVKVALTPFGRTGPKANWRASANVLLAMGGYTHLMGDPDRAPLSLPGHYLEFQTGAVAFTAASAARWAEQAGSIDIGQFETLLSLSQFTTVRWHCAGEIRARHGSDFWFVVPSQLFPCADGFVYLNIVPSFWDPLTVFLDMPELLMDPRFENNDLRMANRQALHKLMADELARHTTTTLIQRAEICRVPLGVVLSFEQVLADPHLQARQFWQALPGDADEPLYTPAYPFLQNLADTASVSGARAW